MLNAYRDLEGSFAKAPAGEMPDDVIWIDLVDPSAEERRLVEGKAGLVLPSRDDLGEIEASSRLVVRKNVLYLSTPSVAGSETADAHLTPTGFIVSARLLVTIRYAELSTFDSVVTIVGEDPSLDTSIGIFTAMIEAIVDRGADVLEHLGAEIDRISRSTFRGDPTDRRHPVRSTERLRETVSRIGAIGDRASQARDVLLGVGRIASFAADIGSDWIAEEFHVRLAAVCKDVASLNDYEAHLSNKVQFLLDAVLGYINIQQNDLFKVLTIASVVGIPPTIMVGVWGMNFKHMPELDWTFGYPLALLAVVLSALLPLAWFKAKGWF